MAKKTNEAWFGDSFDRGTLTAYNASNGEICFTANNCKINSEALDALTGCTDHYTIATANCGSDYAIAKGATSYVDAIAMQSDVTTIQDELKKLQKQIDELNKAKINSVLRQQMKTLRYTREVE